MQLLREGKGLCKGWVVSPFSADPGVVCSAVVPPHTTQKKKKTFELLKRGGKALPLLWEGESGSEGCRGARERERKRQGLQGFLCKPLRYLHVLSGSFVRKTQPLFPEDAEPGNPGWTKNRKEGRKHFWSWDWLNLAAHIFFLSCPVELVGKGRACGEKGAAAAHRLWGKAAAAFNPSGSSEHPYRLLPERTFCTQVLLIQQLMWKNLGSGWYSF